MKKNTHLNDAVEKAISDYFAALEDQSSCNLYQLFLREVEAPMLKVVMERTNDNQSKAAEMLGLNRGTLRKKLKDYNII